MHREVRIQFPGETPLGGIHVAEGSTLSTTGVWTFDSLKSQGLVCTFHVGDREPSVLELLAGKREPVEKVFINEIEIYSITGVQVMNQDGWLFGSFTYLGASGAAVVSFQASPDTTRVEVYRA